MTEANGPFLAISWSQEASTRQALRGAGELVREITRYLRGIARGLEDEPFVLLLFPSPGALLDYLADFHPEEGEFGMMAASFIGRETELAVPHVAMSTDRGSGMALDEVLAHELTHACVAHLDLPLWLDEGFATVMQQTALGRGRAWTPQDIGVQRDFWTSDTLQWFWSGSGFYDAEAQGASYELAEFLLRSLSSDYDKLVAFAHTARWDDGGAAAFRSVYGRDLGTALRGILGPGDWQPRPEEWSVGAPRGDAGGCDAD